MTDSTSAAPRHHDLRDVGDLVDRMAKVARINGITGLTIAADGLSISLSLVPHASGSETVVARYTESTVILPTAPATPAMDHVTSPMVGTFYTGSGPGEAPFVEPGDRVEVGQTIGIIEAMKIMNEIPTEIAGTILDVLVTNGQAVEYGTPLYRIDADAGEAT